MTSGESDEKWPLNWNCWLRAIWLGDSLCRKIGFGERGRQNYKFNIQGKKQKELVTNRTIPQRVFDKFNLF